MAIRLRMLPLIICVGLVGCRSRMGNRERIVEHFRPTIVTSPGEMHSRSIGELMYENYLGKWQKSYLQKATFSFGHRRIDKDGYTIGSVRVPAGNIWTDSHRKLDGTLLLTSATVRRRYYALEINADGSLHSNSCVYQISRNIIQRIYPIFNAPEGEVFEFQDVTLRRRSRASGWGLYYIGQKNGLLRFKIFELNARGDKFKEVIYEHDYQKGKEMVVRGVRFRVDKLQDDGIINYRIIP